MDIIGVIINSYKRGKQVLLFKDLNHRYNLGFDIILNEQEETAIYKTIELDQVIDTVGQRIFGHYRVIDFREIGGKTYYLLTSKSGIIGWTNLSESITIYKKEIEPVKIFDKIFEINDVNNNLRLDLRNVDINKVYMSKGFIILNGNVLEVLYSKNTLIGFFNPNELDHSLKINDKMNLSNVEEFYLDSGFLTKAEDVKNESLMHVIDYFPNLKIIRLKHKNSLLWAKVNKFEHEKLNRKREQLSDLSYSNLFAIHLAYSYEEDREKAKKVIRSLIDENQSLLETLSNNQTRNNLEYTNDNQKNYKTLYQNLKTSKLGKIQIAYWRYLDKRRKNKR